MGKSRAAVAEDEGHSRSLVGSKMNLSTNSAVSTRYYFTMVSHFDIEHQLYTSTLDSSFFQLSPETQRSVALQSN